MTGEAAAASGLSAALLLVTTMTASCGSPREATDASILTDPAGYTLTVPRGWSVTEHFDSDDAIRADITATGEMGLQLRLADVKPSSFSSTAETLIREYASDMSTHWGGRCEEIERVVPDAGYQSLTTRFHAEYADGAQWYLQLSLISRGTTMLVLQCGCRWEDRQEGRAAFDGIVESVGFSE
ncbi:MAG: hypothetical protein JXR55_06875 [Candidatus Fermentibacteraceae bacterium]|nr:hypothetical protein [Candidatus Fermentibacteraceae bacterium]